MIISAREMTGEDFARLNGGLAQLKRNGPYGAVQVRDFLRDTLAEPDGDETETPLADKCNPEPRA